MRVQVIAPPCRQAMVAESGLAAELGDGAGAMLKAGVLDELEALGVEVVGTARPVLEREQSSGDEVVDLGTHGALIAQAVVEGQTQGALPLLIGGTCCHVPGMMAGLQAVHGATARIGLIWMDAHGDFNTPAISPSGMLGGMPVATSAGLCHHQWREGAGQRVPLPTDRIVFVDVRNLDLDEAKLIGLTEAAVTSIDARRPGRDAREAIRELAERVDHLYLHVDADVLDARYQPNHPTVEPEGPDMDTTLETIEAAMKTGKVRAFAVVSVNPSGPDGPTSVASGKELIRGGVERWEAQEAQPLSIGSSSG